MAELKTNPKLREAIEKYDAKFDRIVTRLPPGSRKRIEKLGYKSTNAFIVLAVVEKLEREEGYKK